MWRYVNIVLPQMNNPPVLRYGTKQLVGQIESEAKLSIDKMRVDDLLEEARKEQSESSEKGPSFE